MRASCELACELNAGAVRAVLRASESRCAAPSCQRCAVVPCRRVVRVQCAAPGLCTHVRIWGDGSVQSVRVAGNAQVLTLLMLWMRQPACKAWL